MPQPLKRLPPDFRLEPDALERRPKLAIKIARISAIWSEVEIDLGVILAVTLHAHASIGVAMYQALSGSAAQEHVLSAALQKLLPNELFAQVPDLLKEIRHRAKERNRIVHCMWGTSDEHPDALIHCSPDNLMKDLSETYSWFIYTQQTREPSEDYVKGLMAYKEPDFVATEGRIRELQAKLRKFGLQVGEFVQKRSRLAHALLTGPALPTTPTPPDTPQTNPSEPGP